MKQLIILSILALVISACNLSSQNNATEVIHPAATNDETIGAPVEPRGQDTISIHHDTLVGFSFAYPQDWWLSSGENPNAVAYAITLQSETPGIGGGGIPAGVTKLDIYVDRSRNDMTIAELQERNHRNRDAGRATTLQEETHTLNNGMAAIYLRQDSAMGGVTSSLLLIINGHGIQITLYGDENYLWQIANSIQLD